MGFLLAWPATRRVAWSGTCRMGDNVSAGFPRWLGSPSFTASQHGPLDKMGDPPNATVWRYSCGDTSGCIWRFLGLAEVADPPER